MGDLQDLRAAFGGPEQKLESWVIKPQENTSVKYPGDLGSGFFPR
jgi:hypothetical protein